MVIRIKDKDKGFYLPLAIKRNKCNQEIKLTIFNINDDIENSVSTPNPNQFNENETYKIFYFPVQPDNITNFINIIELNLAGCEFTGSELYQGIYITLIKDFNFPNSPIIEINTENIIDIEKDLGSSELKIKNYNEEHEYRIFLTKIGFSDFTKEYDGNEKIKVNDLGIGKYYWTVVDNTNQTVTQSPEFTLQNEGLNELKLKINELKDETQPFFEDGYIKVSSLGGAEPYTYYLKYDDNIINQNSEGEFWFLKPGNYSIECKDINDEYAYIDFIINEYNEEEEGLDISIEKNNPSEYGKEDGWIKLLINGEESDNFIIEWHGPYGFKSFGYNIENLTQGKYTISIFNIINNKISKREINLEPPKQKISNFSILINKYNETYENSKDGKITINIEDNINTTYTFNLSKLENDENIHLMEINTIRKEYEFKLLESGNYKLIITDSNDRYFESDIISIFSFDSSIQFNINKEDITANGLDDGKINIEILNEIPYELLECKLFKNNESYLNFKFTDKITHLTDLSQGDYKIVIKNKETGYIFTSNIIRILLPSLKDKLAVVLNIINNPTGYEHNNGIISANLFNFEKALNYQFNLYYSNDNKDYKLLDTYNNIYIPYNFEELKRGWYKLDILQNSKVILSSDEIFLNHIKEKLPIEWGKQNITAKGLNNGKIWMEINDDEIDLMSLVWEIRYPNQKIETKRGIKNLTLNNLSSGFYGIKIDIISENEKYETNEIIIKIDEISINQFTKMGPSIKVNFKSSDNNKRYEYVFTKETLLSKIIKSKIISDIKYTIYNFSDEVDFNNLEWKWFSEELKIDGDGYFQSLVIFKPGDTLVIEPQFNGDIAHIILETKQK